MNKQTVLGLIRHILTGVGGALVTQGVASTDDLNLIVGGVVAIVGVVWSVIDKRKAA